MLVQRQQVDGVVSVELIDFPLIRPVEVAPTALLDVNLVPDKKALFDFLCVSTAIFGSDHVKHGRVPFSGDRSSRGAAFDYSDKQE